MKQIDIITNFQHQNAFQKTFIQTADEYCMKQEWMADFHFTLSICKKRVAHSHMKTKNYEFQWQHR